MAASRGRVPGQIAASHEVGADAMELHTGRYANAETETEAFRELELLRAGVKVAMGAALVVHAGHGLNYQNTGPVAALDGIEDLNIGHSIVARAVLTGLEQAVRDMLAILRDSERS